MNSAESYFEDVLMRVIEGIATEEEFATFAEIVHLDAELRQRYAREMRLHALLSCLGEENFGVRDDAHGPFRAAEAAPRGYALKSPSAPCPASDSLLEEGPSAPCPHTLLFLRGWWKVAAAVTLLLSGVAVWYATETRRSEELGVGGEETLASAVPAVRLVRQKGVKGLDLPETLPGELRLESGEVVVRLQTGVELTLIGPASMVVQSGLRVTMERGRLLANVPHWAMGFTVRTTDLEVYDLGTVFSVNVTEGGADVFVFKGSVQVNEAGFSESGRETSGSGVGICEAGEGVRSVRGELPVKFETDWVEAQKMFGGMRGDTALKHPTAAMKTAGQIADLWAERYMPGSNLLPKKIVKGNGIPFQKTAWVRPSVPQQEESDMKKSSVAAIMTAAAVMMGAGTSAAFSEPVLVQTSPCINRHWSTIFTNEVPLKWNWSTAATHAEMEITGMNGAFATNFTEVTSNFLWRAFASSVPSVEDVYDLTLTFYNNSESVVGVLTSQLSVVTGAFGETAVDPGPSTRGWTTVRNNAVIPYDATWAAATADAASSRLVIAKVGGATQTNALANASGYYGWKLRNSGWGYGTFNLALTFPGMVGEWDATLTRPVDGTMIRVW